MRGAEWPGKKKAALPLLYEAFVTLMPHARLEGNYILRRGIHSRKWVLNHRNAYISEELLFVAFRDHVHAKR